MNAIPSTIQAALPAEPINIADAAVNEWRGRCIDAFSRVEAAITDCLLTMSLKKDGGARVGLPHLSGQRLEALAAAVAEGGPFEAYGPSIMPTLAIYRPFAETRNLLCHGVFSVTLARHGRWTAVARMTSLCAKRALRETLVLTREEAKSLAHEITQASRQFCAQLDKLRASVS